MLSHFGKCMKCENSDESEENKDKGKGSRCWIAAIFTERANEDSAGRGRHAYQAG